jgi:putative xylitol transport system ATP-binding protein
MKVARHEVRSRSDLLIKAKGIGKSYGGVLALHDGCIELRAGTVHALCGGNGAGKSTFLNILMGLEAPDGGRIWLSGSETRFASPASALAAGIAIITQELSPVPDGSSTRR